MELTGQPSVGRTPRSHAGARTCVGCRRRADRSALLRVVAVAVGDEAQQLRLVPDPQGRLPGRGAWLHPTCDCLDKAVVRKAFGRALRLGVPVDPGDVLGYIARHQQQ